MRTTTRPSTSTRRPSRSPRSRPICSWRAPPCTLSSTTSPPPSATPTRPSSSTPATPRRTSARGSPASTWRSTPPPRARLRRGWSWTLETTSSRRGFASATRSSRTRWSGTTRRSRRSPPRRTPLRRRRPPPPPRPSPSRGSGTISFRTPRMSLSQYTSRGRPRRRARWCSRSSPSRSTGPSRRPTRGSCALTPSLARLSLGSLSQTSSAPSSR
mmetsp:Transcript_29641/g.69256  ORF Transcript_29641/g.69256 Transcript_29641/m.69256 type:complete len:214 (+) Transcript_29641:120-761(+)